jgi:hypothetical protein
LESGLPDAAAFQQYVLGIIETYPTDGTHAYYWPKRGSWKGVTRDIVYNGETIADGDDEGRCHCSGITWEVFMRALEAYNEIEPEPALTAWTREDVTRFQFLWFGSDGDKRCIQHAVQAFGIGRDIAHDDAHAGDFVQFWRGNGLGHSAVFIDWVRDKDGNIAAMKYWSSQKKTNGIAYNVETVGGNGILLDQTYIVRIGRADGVGRDSSNETQAVSAETGR